MKLKTFINQHTSVVVAVIGVAVSLVALLFQITLSRDLLLKYGIAVGGGVVAVVYAYLMGRIYQRFRDGRRKRVFISYSHADTEFAMRLASELVEMGARPVIDRLELKVGDDIRAGIDKMIESCPYVIVVASKNSRESQWINKEALQALKREKIILPVCLDPDAIPEGLEGIYYADFSKDFDHGLNQLKRVFKAA